MVLDKLDKLNTGFGVLTQTNGILSSVGDNVELLAQNNAPEYFGGLKPRQQIALRNASRVLAGGDVNWPAIEAAATIVDQLPTLFRTGGIAQHFPASAFGYNKTVITYGEHELLNYYCEQLDRWRHTPNYWESVIIAVDFISDSRIALLYKKFRGLTPEEKPLGLTRGVFATCQALGAIVRSARREDRYPTPEDLALFGDSVYDDDDFEGDLDDMVFE
jgi:hypothetical protein